MGKTTLNLEIEGLSVVSDAEALGTNGGYAGQYPSPSYQVEPISNNIEFMNTDWNSEGLADQFTTWNGDYQTL
jgi:hypothetical protein